MAQAVLPAEMNTAAPIPAGVASRLRGLRRKLTLWFVVDGLSRVLLTVVLVIAVDLLLDWYFVMDRAQRGVMLVLGAVAIGVVAWRRLIRPLTTQTSDDALCLEVEDHYHELGESLISAVQLSRMPAADSQRMSPEMVRATITHGVAAAERVPFGGVLRTGRFYANLALLVLAAALLALGGVAVANTSTGNIWFDRNILLGSQVWPQDVHFEVEGLEEGVLLIPRGDDWPLAVLAKEGTRPLPDELEVQIEIRTGRDRRRETLERATSGEQRYTLALKNVIEPFEFQIRSGSSWSPWHEARLVPRPEVESLSLSVIAPKYAGGEVEPLPEGRGPYHILKGSQLQVRGKATKALSGATLQVGETSHPVKVVGENEFEITLPAEHVSAATYRIDLLDQESLFLPGRAERGPLNSKRPVPFTLRIRPDREPDIKARLVGISGMVVSGAKIPCKVRITDDFAVRDVRLVYDWQSEEDETLRDEGELPLTELKPGKDPSRLSFDYTWQLAALKIPANSRLRFTIQANDNDDISGPKTGRSTAFLLRVVSEDELRADLLRREKEQRQEFERLTDQQDEMFTECDAILVATREKAELPAEQRGTLVRIQKRQKLLGANVQAISERLATIIDELLNNDLEEADGPLQTRLRSKIIDPMQQIAGVDIPAAAQELDRARNQAGSAQPRDKALTLAVDGQQKIHEMMKQILLHMVKSEGYQEAVNLLYEIERSQQEVFKMTDKEREARIRELLKKRDGEVETPPEKPSIEKPSTEKPESEQPPAENPTEQKPDGEPPAVVKPAADKPSEEKPAAEKPAAEKPATE